MALSDSSIAAPEHSSDRASDDIAATEDDNIGTGNLDTGVVQKLDDTRGGARREERLRGARRQVTDVVCVEPVRR